MQTKQLSDLRRLETEKQAYLLPINSQDKDMVPIGEFLSLGRSSSNSMILHDPYVSQKHARIEKKRNRYALTDLRSSNGTFLNGTPIVESWLQNHDKIRLGEKCFVFTVQGNSELSIKSKNLDWQKQIMKIPSFAKTDFNVLILGPSGSGKEITAKTIHENSKRLQGPFVTINCSALSESLIESELFGHVRGAYTGATEDRKGAFASAKGGTLFLDEIGDLPLSLQPKLLRAIENKEIRPVGSDKTISTDVRILSATHKDLYGNCLQKQFREDLYHRLNVCRIEVPPLIERMEDFEGLLFDFAKEFRVSFSFDAIKKLKNYGWPGNIRELKNSVARASAYFGGEKIQTTQIDEIIDRQKPIFTQHLDQGESLSTIKNIERDLIIQKLQEHHGNQSKVADDLNMPKSTLHDRLKTYNINAKHYRQR